MEYTDIQYMSVRLPEDILRLKLSGHLKEALRVIDVRLSQNIPEALKKKLTLEKIVISNLAFDYTLARKDVVREAKKDFEDFTEKELQDLKDRGVLEWIFVEGEERFFNRSVSAIARERERQNRLKDLKNAVPPSGDYMDKAIEKMKTQGRAGYRIHMKTTLRIADKSFRPGIVKVHMPIPAVCREISQISNVVIKDTSMVPSEIADIYAPQRTVFFDEMLQENSTFFVEYEYDNIVGYNAPQAEKVLSLPKDSCFDEYLKEQPPHILFTPLLKSLAKEIAGNETNPLIIARSIYDYITAKLCYSYMREYFNIDMIPEYIVTRGMGDCGVQELLFITLCRICGIPARWQSGLSAKPDYAGSHDWGAFYIAPYGWMFNDCSVGGSAYKEGRLDKWDFYFSNIDPFRMPANNAFQCEFYPPKRFIRIDPYDNQSGEAEYEDRGLSSDELISTKAVLSVTEIDV